MSCHYTDDEVCLSLIKSIVQFRRLSHKQFKQSEPEVHNGLPDDDELKHSEIGLLFALDEVEEQFPNGVSAVELSGIINVKPPTVNPMIFNLEKHGLIKREKDIKDRRIIRITLSENGKAFIYNHKIVFVKKIGGLVNELGPDKSRELASLLNEVYTYFLKAMKN